jgi:hypothetical protein
MMERTAIAALAKGLVPFVREVVANALSPLAARLAEIEKREPEPAIVLPPDIADQVASAVRLLHELPPAATRSAPRVTRIERDDTGALVPIYDEPPA